MAKPLGLGDVLPHKSIHVVVCTSFPGFKEMGEKEFYLHVTCNPFVDCDPFKARYISGIFVLEKVNRMFSSLLLQFG